MIKIKSQNFISGQGERSNNEDNCGFIKGHTFVVCDGVGGNEKGEIASDIAVKGFIESLKKNPDRDLNDILIEVETQFTNFISSKPEAIGMATTLTLTTVKENGILAAWCGDSRIYQFRKGKIIFQSTDHSWVNEALQSGIITSEEAINHPKSNVITRAIQGSHKPAQMDEVFLTDIHKGDLFIQCTDGVLESWSETELQRLFSQYQDVEIILSNINEKCSEFSKDNFTAIVYSVDEAKIDLISNQDRHLSNTTKDVVEVQAQLLTDEDIKSLKSAQNTNSILRRINRKYVFLFLVSLSLITIFLVLWFVVFRVSNENSKPIKQNESIVHPKTENQEGNDQEGNDKVI